LRVTAFKDYLACPYRFWLRHVQRLEPVPEPADELDPRDFGSLAHDVLERLREPGWNDCVDPRELADRFSRALDELVLRKFGSGLPAPAEIQHEQLRARLASFARRQAARAAEGWRVQATEFVPEEAELAFEVDGMPFRLAARVDRLDRNERTGEWCVLDYKTGEGGKTPDAAHRCRGEWVDLQLPLYWRMLRGRAAGARLRVAYGLLPRRVEDAAIAEAPWSDAELEDAVAAARQAVRRLRAEVFWPPASPAPANFGEFAALCRDDVRVAGAS
jgi:ATP-dependent helicase/nuclease subunit B